METIIFERTVILAVQNSAHNTRFFSLLALCELLNATHKIGAIKAQLSAILILFNMLVWWKDFEKPILTLNVFLIFQEAEEMHIKAIQIKEQLLGQEDYEVALSVGHLASLYNYDMNQYENAEKLYLRSIAIGG